MRADVMRAHQLVIVEVLVLVTLSSPRPADDEQQQESQELIEDHESGRHEEENGAVRCPGREGTAGDGEAAQHKAAQVRAHRCTATPSSTRASNTHWEAEGQEERERGVAACEEGADSVLCVAARGVRQDEAVR